MEMSIPYFLIRLHINSYQRRKEFTHLIFILVGILFIVGLPESITGRQYIREIAANIMGDTRSYFTSDQRLGIWRAAGPMDHPILFGSVCASITAVAISMALRKARYWVVLFFSIGGTILSASSGPLLSLIVQLGLIFWGTIFKGLKNRWWLFSILVVVGYITIDLISNRNPIQVMFTYLLINPSTGYARYHMWINSFQVVTQSELGMLFGYGYDKSIFNVIESNYYRILMQNTIDSFWLVQMVRYGMIMVVLFVLFLLLTFIRTAKTIKNTSERKDKKLLQAWLFSAVAMTLVASTVHFWEQILCIYMMVLAICVCSTNKKHPRKTIPDKAASSMYPSRPEY